MIAMALVASVVLAAGQTTVYRCTQADGTPVFSDQPCGRGSHKIDVAPLGHADPDAVRREQALEAGDASGERDHENQSRGAELRHRTKAQQAAINHARMNDAMKTVNKRAKQRRDRHDRQRAGMLRDDDAVRAAHPLPPLPPPAASGGK